MTAPLTTAPERDAAAPTASPLPTLTAALAANAARRPDALAYAFLPDGLTEGARLTWSELQARVQGLAGVLAGRLPRGSRVMLLVLPGLETVVAVHACFAAGMVGVPVAPPSPRAPAAGLASLERVAIDAGIGAVLSTTEVAAAFAGALEATPTLRRQPWLLVDEAPADGGSGPSLPLPEPSELAYLQYTSGSTRAPRGVMLGHAQFSHNVETIRTQWAMDDGDVAYTWLPPWHDMGLVAGLLAGTWTGIPTHVAPPLAIARRPRSWLQAISALGVTISGGPDFMYRACTAQATPELLASLDLSRWRVACSGSEPVRASTLRAFRETFSAARLPSTVFAPAYGMAESTLAVASVPAATPLVIQAFDRAALAAGRAVPVPAIGERRGDDRPGGPPGGPVDLGQDAVEMVGNGFAAGGQELAIVDPITRRRLPDGAVGEAWTRGPSVGTGYWERPEETAATFGARLDGEDGAGDDPTWLRSGDVAFVHDGHLFVSGRLKDVIILNGIKRHAVDLELAAQESHPALATRAAAAFSVDDGATERVVLVIEAPRERLADDDAAAILTAVRRAVARAVDVQAARIVLVAAGSIPKTTSGKVQRGLTRDGLAAGALVPVHEWNAQGGTTP